jgi:hypothetical protein
MLLRCTRRTVSALPRSALRQSARATVARPPDARAVNRSSLHYRAFSTASTPAGSSSPPSTSHTLGSDVRVRIRVPALSTSRRPTVKPPTGAAPGDHFYCRFPFPPHDHLIVGTDGSVFDERAGRWIPKQQMSLSTPASQIIGAAAPSSSPALGRAHAVLLAHGHAPRDYVDSIVVYRDQDQSNCALSNLFWFDFGEPENHPPLVEAMATAKLNNKILNFSQLLPWFPSLHIGSDGRIFDHRLQRFLTDDPNSTSGELHTHIAKGPGRFEPVTTHRYLLVWAAHSGRGQFPATSKIAYVDGDSKNCAIENLKEVEGEHPPLKFS